MKVAAGWKTFVVEDEEITQKHICTLIDEDLELNLVGASDNVQGALKDILKLQPDLLLLDIQIADGDSFEILSELSYTPEIIFITAFDKFAVRAFEESAIDYVLKPFDKARLGKALAKAKERLNAQETGKTLEDLKSLLAQLTDNRSQESVSDQISIKIDGRTVLRKANEIKWIEASKNQAVLHLDQVSYPIRETLASLEERLAVLNFVRIHRSTIVNLEYVEEIQNWFHGDHVLILKDGTSLKMSRRYKGNLEKRISGKL
jgi:two-component system LytT family response regulator